jgi:hypothetical protein
VGALKKATNGAGSLLPTSSDYYADVFLYQATGDIVLREREVIHIYDNLTTSLTRVFSDANYFTPIKTFIASELTTLDLSSLPGGDSKENPLDIALNGTITATELGTLVDNLGTKFVALYLSNGAVWVTPTPTTVPANVGKITSLVLTGEPATLGLTSAYINLEAVDLSGCSTLTEIPSSAFTSCPSLKSVTVPTTLTEIADDVFTSCLSLKSIDLSGCAALTTVDLSGTGLTTVSSTMFTGCTSLATITLPATVTSIAASAFSTCTSSITLTVNAITPPTLGAGALPSELNNVTIKVPSTSMAAYKAADGWSTYETKIQAITL